MTSSESQEAANSNVSIRLVGERQGRKREMTSSESQEAANSEEYLDI